jgi:DNA-binding LacI/PurR family transcriptional regulator
VSRSTVSNILNGNDARFPEATRERVHAAAHELEYQPSLAGRSLVSGISDTVVILLPNTTFGSNLQDAVDEIMTGTSQFGANVVVRFAGKSLDSSVDAVMAFRPLAVIDFAGLSVSARRRMARRGTVVLPDGGNEADRNLPDAGAAVMQANALLAGGERRLCFASLSDDRFDAYGPGRYEALQRFCIETGREAPGHIHIPLALDGAVEAIREVLPEDGTALGLACYNDDVALAVLAAARELRIQVPGRLSVVGVDHTAIGQLWSPPLTTIATDLRGIMADVSRDLRARLSGTTPEPSTTQRMPFTLIPGGTT